MVAHELEVNDDLMIQDQMLVLQQIREELRRERMEAQMLRIEQNQREHEEIQYQPQARKIKKVKKKDLFQLRITKILAQQNEACSFKELQQNPQKPDNENTCAICVDEF